MNAITLAHQTGVAAKRSLFLRLLDAYAVWMQRKHLATLDDAALQDIGLTRHEAQTEAARPMLTIRWNAPDNWLR